MPTTARATKGVTEGVEDLAATLREQASESIRQGYEVVSVARDQAISSIKQSQQFALDALAKWGEIAGKVTPQVPGLPTAELGKTIDAGFAVAEELLAAQHKLMTTMLETLIPTAN